MIPILQKVGTIKTEYNTDDIENPKEIATLYNVFEVVNGVRSGTLFFITFVRQKSKIVLKQQHGPDFIDAMVQYHRIIRNRAEQWHPIAVMVQQMEAAYEEGEAYEP